MGIGGSLLAAGIGSGTGQASQRGSDRALQLLRDRLAHSRNLETIEKQGEVSQQLASMTNLIAAMLGDPTARDQLLRTELRGREAGAESAELGAELQRETLGSQVRSAGAGAGLAESQLRVQEGTEQGQIDRFAMETELLGEQIGLVEAQTLAENRRAGLIQTQTALNNTQQALAQIDLESAQQFRPILDQLNIQMQQLQTQALSGEIGLQEANQRMLDAQLDILDADMELRETMDPALYYALNNASQFDSMLEPLRQTLDDQQAVIQQTLDRLSEDELAVLAELGYDTDLIEDQWFSSDGEMWAAFDSVAAQGPAGTSIVRAVNNALEIAGLPNIEDGKEIRTALDARSQMALRFLQGANQPDSDPGTSGGMDPISNFSSQLQEAGVNLDHITAAFQGGLTEQSSPVEARDILLASGVDLSNPSIAQAYQNALSNIFQLARTRQMDPSEIITGLRLYSR